MLGGLQFSTGVLDIQLGGGFALHSEERHHASIQQIGSLALHLHGDVLNDHAVDDGKGLKIDLELFQLLRVVGDIVHLLLERNIVVGFVTGALSLETSDGLFDVALHHPQLGDGLLLRALDLSGDLVVKLLILDRHLVLKLPDLLLENLVRLFDLEIGDLRAQRLDLFTDLLDELAPVLALELGGASCHDFYLTVVR